jgi:4-amino-4-deoxy-L-arabinose transferase-like glycosyltransferase
MAIAVHSDVVLPAGRPAPNVGLALALIAAAMLRFWALPAGVPFAVQIDEPEVMERAIRMMRTGDFGPHFFDYPALYMYVQAVTGVARFLFGAMRGEWASLAQASTEHFYIWGRAVTATLGTATVWLVYRAGMRWGERTALLAAVMLAVMPLHVRESHFTLTDVPTTFLVVLTLLLSLRAHERATLGAFLLAAGAAGLAGATKYNGGIAVVLPLMACAMTPALGRRRIAAMAWIAVAMVATFLLAAPYTLIDLPTFLNQFARLSSEYRARGIAGEPVWMVYLKHLRIALQTPGSLLVLAGLGLGLYRVLFGPMRLKWVLATVFPLVYFRFISNQNIIYARYLLPLVPFLSLLAAAAVVWTVDRLRRWQVPTPVRNGVTVLLTVITIAPPAYTSIRFDANTAKVWTTQQAYEWVRQELPEGTVVWTETRAFLLPPTIKAQYVKELRLVGVTDFRATDVQYLVTSSQNSGVYYSDCRQFRNECADYEKVFAQTEEVARFTPSSDHPGPEIRILKVKR